MPAVQFSTTPTEHMRSMFVFACVVSTVAYLAQFKLAQQLRPVPASGHDTFDLSHLCSSVFRWRACIAFFQLVVRNKTQACKVSCSSAKMRNPWAARQCDHFMASVYARKSAGALYEKEASKLPSEEKQRQAIAEGVHTAKTCQSSVFGIFECSFAQRM